MADENKLATFKWFTDTHTCGTLDSDPGISDTIFNYISPNSDKVINYKNLITPENYTNKSIANKTNFEDGEGNTKCILQSHINELLNVRYKYKIGFQKSTLNSGKQCLYIKMIDIANANTPPDNKLKIKIIIFKSENDDIGEPYNVNINISTLEKDYTYIIVDNIYRVEIVAVSVFRANESSYRIVKPQIEYYYTYSLIGVIYLISAKDKEENGDFNGSKITKGERIDNFVSGSSTPGTGDNSGGSGDSDNSGDSTTQKDLVILDNWINLDTAVNTQSDAKICWAGVDYIINDDTILLYNNADIFMGDDPIYALLSNSSEIIEQIKIIDNDYNNSDKYIFVAFEELYSTKRNTSEITGLENYYNFENLPETLQEFELTNFIDYGENLIEKT